MIRVNIAKSHIRNSSLNSNISSNSIDRCMTSTDSHQRLLQLKNLSSRHLWSLVPLRVLNPRMNRPYKVKVNNKIAIEEIGEIIIIITQITISVVVEEEIVADVTTTEAITTMKRTTSFNNDLRWTKHSMVKSTINSSSKITMEKIITTIEDENAVEEVEKTNKEMVVKIPM